MNSNKTLILIAFAFLFWGAKAMEMDTIQKLTLSEVVVVGTRWQQAANEIPSKITVISPFEVQLQNPQTAADLLGISGKVYIQKSQQGGGSPMIRGFATNRLLYSVDGVRMNTAIFRAGNIQNVISLDPFALENTEVLFGPGSVLYGSDAIGGVMSFNTLTPRFSAGNTPLVKGNFVSRYSSANAEKTAHFDVNVGWRKWSMLTSFSVFNFGDVKQGRYGPKEYLKPFYVVRQNDKTDVTMTNPDPLVQTPSGYSQMNLMQKIRFKPTANWDLQYALHYSETSPYSRYDRHTRLRKGLPRYAEWEYGPQVWMMNNLTATHSGNNLLYNELTLRLAQQQFEESRIDRNLNDTLRNTQTEKVKAYSANLDFLKKTCDKNTLFYGLEYVMNDVNSAGVTTNLKNNAAKTSASRYPQANWYSAALYVSDQFAPTEKVTLQAGVRYNHYGIDANFNNPGFRLPFDSISKINKGSLSGNAGVTYRPDETWALSLNLARGFRSPNVDDMGKIFESIDKTVTVPNPHLKPEYANNIEIGVAKTVGNVLKFDVTGYYTHLQNAMVRRGFQLNGQDSVMYKGVKSRVLAIQNAALATVYGVQLGLQANLGSGFTFSTHLNYQKGTEELDNGEKSPMRHAAPFFGNAALGYAAKNLTIQFYSAFQAERKHSELAEDEKGKTEIYALDADNKTYCPGWLTLNFKSHYRLTENIAVSAGVENLTDRRYRTYSSGISAPGRNIYASLQLKF